MEKFIRKKLKENLNYWHADDASPEKNEYEIQSEDTFLNDSGDKWSKLEKDVSSAIIPLIDKYQNEFGSDSYAVIDAIEQIFDKMFEKVKY